jgi:hypothetical protein
MTIQHEVCEWSFCGGRDRPKTIRRKVRRPRRPHSDWILELALMLALALLLPSPRKAK